MDYTAILTELNNASLFELYRLNVAIRQQLDDPARLRAIRNHVKTGQLISYFDAVENRLIEATIVELKRTNILVENKHDGELGGNQQFLEGMVVVQTQVLKCI